MFDTAYCNCGSPRWKSKHYSFGGGGGGGGQHLVEIEHYSVAYFHCFSVQSKRSAELLLKAGLVHAV